MSAAPERVAGGEADVVWSAERPPSRIASWWADGLRGFGWLDTPWLVLLLAPLRVLPGLLGIGAGGVPLHWFVLGAVVASGRRWGVAVVPPTLVLALGMVLPIEPIGTGNLLFAPALLLAARLGYDPALLRSIQSVDRLTGADRLVLLALILIPSLSIETEAARRGVVPLNLYPGSALLPPLMVLLGLSAVRLRAVLLLLVIGFMALWLFGPTWSPGRRIASVLDWDFGLWPHDVITMACLLLMGRAWREPASLRWLQWPMIVTGPILVVVLLGQISLSVWNPISSLVLESGHSYGFTLSPQTVLAWALLTIVLTEQAAGTERPSVPHSARALIAAIVSVPAVLAFLPQTDWSVPLTPGSGIRLSHERLSQSEFLLTGAWLAGAILLIPVIVRRLPSLEPARVQGEAGFVGLVLGRPWRVLILVVPVILATLVASLLLSAPAGDRFRAFKPEAPTAQESELMPAEDLPIPVTAPQSTVPTAPATAPPPDVRLKGATVAPPPEATRAGKGARVLRTPSRRENGSEMDETLRDLEDSRYLRTTREDGLTAEEGANQNAN